MMKKQFFIYLCFVLFLSSCVQGVGPVVTQTLNISNFDSIRVNKAIEVEITQGNTFNVYAEGNENIIEDLNKSVVDGYWNIDLEGAKFGYSNYTLKLKITCPTLKSVTNNSKRELTINDFNINNNISLYCLRGDINVSSISTSGVVSTFNTSYAPSFTSDEDGEHILIEELYCNELNTYVKNDGSIEYYTSDSNNLIPIHNITIDSAGSVNSHQIKCQSVNINSVYGGCSVSPTENLTANLRSSYIEINGVDSLAPLENIDIEVDNESIGLLHVTAPCLNINVKNFNAADIHVWPINNLNAEIHSSGNIYYRGSPATINQNITGTGELINQ